jgi:hypothetical protein
MSLLL